VAGALEKGLPAGVGASMPGHGEPARVACSRSCAPCSHNT